MLFFLGEEKMPHTGFYMGDFILSFLDNERESKTFKSFEKVQH